MVEHYKYVYGSMQARHVIAQRQHQYHHPMGPSSLYLIPFCEVCYEITWEKHSKANTGGVICLYGMSCLHTTILTIMSLKQHIPPLPLFAVGFATALPNPFTFLENALHLVCVLSLVQ